MIEGRNCSQAGHKSNEFVFNARVLGIGSHGEVGRTDHDNCNRQFKSPVLSKVNKYPVWIPHGICLHVRDSILSNAYAQHMSGLLQAKYHGYWK